MTPEYYFPTPQDTTVLSDLDNTLVEGGHKLNSQDIASTIARAKTDGWVIGLSSDTPYEALEIWRDRFGMNGPLIAEKGALIGSEGGLIYNKEDSDAFLDSREKIVRVLFDKGFFLWTGNPVEALRADLRIGNPGNNIALINTLRRCSLGFFFRRVAQDGTMIVDARTTHLGMQDIREFYPTFEVDEDYNEKYGLVIIARKGTNKRSGTKLLMDREGLMEVGMIGDSISDFIGSDIAKHYAVANAASSFKDRADYVAQETLTSGVVEILTRLTNS